MICLNIYVKDNEFPDCFPDNFKDEILPEDAKPQGLSVYRVCKNGSINNEAFCSSYEEALKKGLDKQSAPLKARKNFQRNLRDPGFFATSCFLEKYQLELALDTFLRRCNNAKIVAGEMALEDGLSQITTERNPRGKKGHVDWWLYKTSNPAGYFREVN